VPLGPGDGLGRTPRQVIDRRLDRAHVTHCLGPLQPGRSELEALLARILSGSVRHATPPRECPTGVPTWSGRWNR